jgi:hypothetical protein
LFIRLRIEKILQAQVNPIDSITARKLIQATPKERKIFLEESDLHFQNQNIYERLKKLTELTVNEWENEQVLEYEKCDKQMIIGMLRAEAKTKKIKTTSWSPTFAKAANQKAFWKIALSMKLTHKMPSDDFKTWANTLGIEDVKQLDINTIKTYLRQAQHLLKEIELKADNLRKEHLRDLLTEAELNADENAVKRRLQILIRAHEQ